MPIRVLLVDDSKLARIVTAKVVSGLQPDWERVEASNAEEALAAMANSGIDVALIDYNMPGRNGLELATELRAMRPDMPIAVITANVQDEIIAKARTINAAFVGKPLTADGLRGFVSGAMLRLRVAK